MKKTLRKVLPWIFAALIFYFLFRQIPPAQVLETLGQANIPLFLFLAVLYFFFIMALDCVGLQWAFGRFAAKVTFSETVLMRGVTYLLMLINYNLGQGGMAFYLKRTRGVATFKAMGTVLYLTLIDLGLVLLFGAVAVLAADVSYRGVSLRPLMLEAAGIYGAGFFLMALFLKNLEHPAARLFLKIRPFKWLAHRDIFSTFHAAGPADYAKSILFRIPVILTILFSFYFFIQAFQSHLPLVDIFVYSPIIMVAGTLPITPGGLGTVQALTVEFFKPHLSGPLVESGLYGAAEILLASNLLWVFCNFGLKALFGFFCLRKKSRSLFEETPS